ncbi:MAG: alternative ribosome rescue aminoacyl-tRNA hydrolase ArfB [Actinomycetota bacterium]|jgi:ribosome-associated protein|nr:alternative ribosome rescue aminoacyl-tRNA hydrolase ArfB [Actinomycetota bacterium]
MVPDGVTEATGGVRVNRNLVIPADELQWRFTTSGGPGGQHANRSSTRAEVLFDVERSRVLGPRQRARILHQLGPTVRAASGDERSQFRNRQEALGRLAAQLATALQPRRQRRPTAPSAAARARRLEDKARQAARKRDRSGPADRDDL